MPKQINPFIIFQSDEYFVQSNWLGSFLFAYHAGYGNGGLATCEMVSI